jgi:hypothetical protein
MPSAFYIQPGLIARVDTEKKELFNYNLWTVDSAHQDLIEGLMAPVELKLKTLEAWGRDGDGLERFVNDAPFMSDLLRFAPGADVTEIAGGAALALQEKRPALITLDFLYPQRSPTFGYDVSSETGFPVVDRVGGLDKGVRWMGDLFGLRFIFRGPESHSLGSCVSTPVWHYNLEIHKSLGGGRFQPISNFHLGTYRNGSSKCLVLWNNLTPSVCWKICTINLSNLKAMLAWAVAASAAYAGIYLAGWMVTSIASTLAAAIYASLILL